MRKTEDGEVYYVNHSTKTTQWVREGGERERER